MKKLVQIIILATTMFSCSITETFLEIESSRTNSYISMSDSYQLVIGTSYNKNTLPEESMVESLLTKEDDKIIFQAKKAVSAETIINDLDLEQEVVESPVPQELAEDSETIEIAEGLNKIDVELSISLEEVKPERKAGEIAYDKEQEVVESPISQELAEDSETIEIAEGQNKIDAEVSIILEEVKPERKAGEIAYDKEQEVVESPVSQELAEDSETIEISEGQNKIDVEPSISLEEVKPERKAGEIDSPAEEIILTSDSPRETQNHNAAPSQVIREIDSFTNYLIVFGSYGDRQSALKYVKELQSEGISAVIRPHKSYFRVGVYYDYYPEKELAKFKKSHAPCWVATINTK